MGGFSGRGYAGNRGGYYRGRGYGYGAAGLGVGLGLGLAAGGLGYGYGGYDDGYYGGGYAPAGYGGFDEGDAPAATEVTSDADQVSYCTQRFRSYDLATGTYLGNDRKRHHCP
ncbi:BA14K family protein [Methylobacterium sp. EM32]|uniref:BA14K family protein n=1 Tax=Methylobacterium sp. EM32 TaxID=3163481 RepID=UPI0033B37C96